MSDIAPGGFSATITITDNDSGTMYRYDGGPWIEVCEPGINSNWEPLVYVWDDTRSTPMIDMTIEGVAMALLTFLYSEDGDEA